MEIHRLFFSYNIYFIGGIINLSCEDWQEINEEKSKTIAEIKDKKSNKEDYLDYLKYLPKK